MRYKTAFLLFLVHGLLGGCVLLWPVDEFVPIATEGTIHESHCLARKSMRYQLDGAELRVGVVASGMVNSPYLFYLHMVPAVGQTVRVPVPEVRIQPLDGRPERSQKISSWLGMDPASDAEAVATRGTPPADLTSPMAGRMVTKPTYDGRTYETRFSFGARVLLDPRPAAGYRITLPAIELDGKLVQLAPIEFRYRTRVEWFAPLNC